MKKYVPHHFIAFVLLVGLFSLLWPQPVQAECGLADFACAFKEKIIPGAVFLVLKFISFLTGFAGLLLNLVVKITVVDMGKNLANYPIESTWAVIRDLTNMAFIFIILAAAIKMILGVGTDTRKLIVNLIVAALLINFSLFFTKIVIDASNILAVTFYDAIAPGALTSENALETGLSNSMMEPLRLQSIMSLAENDTVGIGSIITVGIMGSIFLLITSFVFLAVALMLIIRYVVLIFVLILSPIAVITLIFPEAKGYFGKWKTALINQAFFAPVYFLLTWIVIKIFQESPLGKLGDMSAALGGSVNSTGNQLSLVKNFGAFDTVVNFLVIIAFLIVSLMIAKNMSSKSADGFDKMTKWAMGAAGGATLGAAGWAGRKTIGAYGSRIGDDEKLKEMAANVDGKYSTMQQMRGRLNLAAGRKLAGTSFDIRATGLNKSLDAGKAQKGGYAKELKDSAEKMKKFGESLGPSDIVKDETKIARDEAKTARDEARIKYGVGTPEHMMAQQEFMKSQGKVNELEGVSKEEAEKRKKDLASKQKVKLEEVSKIEEKMKTVRTGSPEWESLRKEYGVARTEAEDMGVELATIKEVKGAGAKRKEGYAQAITEENWIGNNQVPFLGKIRKSHKQAAADLRKGKKPVKDVLEDILKEQGDIVKKEEEVKEAVEDLSEGAPPKP